MSSHTKSNVLFRSDWKADKLKTLRTERLPSSAHEQPHRFPRLRRGFTFRATISQPSDFQPRHRAGARARRGLAPLRLPWGDVIPEPVP